jgi:polar amino acid transport system substrate-binding protein
MDRRTLLTSVLGMTALSACGGRIRDPNEVIIGSSPTGVPFSFVDPATNALTGSIVEIAQAVADSLSLQAETRITPFSALLPSLLAHKIDVIAAAMLRTPEREKIVAFSEPVYAYSAALVVPAADRHIYRDLQAIRDLRVGAQVGTRFVDQLRDAGVKNVSTYDGLFDILRDLDNGRIDAGYGDEPILHYQLRVGPRRAVRLVPGFQAPAREELCLILRKDDPLLHRVNSAIERMKNGRFLDIARRWKLEG